ncbi:acyl-CoA dehydrogenase family protein [Patescibacteria group bacterium]|nr:acyl-CoA dehydrogenase family protein [Patescibacteria group bacterium]
MSNHQFFGVDFYKTDELLNERERSMRDTAHAFVTGEVLPIIKNHHREGTFPTELISKMGELGFFGANLQGYGCLSINNIEYGLIMQELERGDSSIRSFASVQSALGMFPIFAFGSEEQKEHWLPLLRDGKAISCFGLTEPDHGSDPANMKTKAIKTKNGFVLSGEKTWITNGDIADIAVVWAKLNGEIRGFLVPKGTAGFTATRIEGKFSLRASITSSLSFSECVIPEKNILPGTILPPGKKGLISALKCLNQARYGIAWGAVGAAMACYHAALDYAKTREQFGKPIASRQLVQEKLVAMLSAITNAQLKCIRLGQLKDAGSVTPTQISLAKRDNVAMALDCARTARDILGAAGITDGHPIIRHLLNLESVKTYEGTHDIHTLILGKEITGIDAF